jgi:transcriptional antiterminator RfaH
MTVLLGRKWYVVRTHAHAEGKAVEHLRRQGFDAYLPRYRKQRRHSRRIEIVASPLFPRYCFVAFDIAMERWHSVRSTFGVERLIGGENGPANVPENVIDDLKRREDQSGFISLDANPRFARGDRVRLMDGALSVCSAFFEEMVDRDRVAVLLDLLGRRVRAVVDGAAIAAE